MIVYLNQKWEKDWGGQIQFHQDPRSLTDEVVSIEPIFNRAVIFETNNHSWHGFPPINLPEAQQHISRKSFALYYYTQSRTATIEPHSTIYVERPLVDKFKQGRLLSDDDVTELHKVIGRRDQHLKRLYDQLTAQTKALSQAKAEVFRYQTLCLDPNEQTKVVKRQLELLSLDEWQLLKRIEELENSSSWKITAPLRKIKRWFNS